MDSKLYKIIGNFNGGILSCGHRIAPGEDYFIEDFGKTARSKCRDCVNSHAEYRLIKIPDDLVDGVIPI